MAESSTAVTLNDFQEKVAERIRASIGDLMPDDVLKGMVERALEESLFKEKIVQTRDNWNNPRSEVKPAFLPGFVADLVKERVDVAVREHIAARSDQINALIQEEIGKGLGEALLKSVRALFLGDLIAFQNNVQNSLARLGQR